MCVYLCFAQTNVRSGFSRLLCEEVVTQLNTYVGSKRRNFLSTVVNWNERRNEHVFRIKENDIEQTALTNPKKKYPPTHLNKFQTDGYHFERVILLFLSFDSSVLCVWMATPIVTYVSTSLQSFFISKKEKLCSPSSERKLTGSLTICLQEFSLHPLLRPYNTQKLSELSSRFSFMCYSPLIPSFFRCHMDE